MWGVGNVVRATTHCGLLPLGSPQNEVSTRTSGPTLGCPLMPFPARLPGRPKYAWRMQLSRAPRPRDLLVVTSQRSAYGLEAGSLCAERTSLAKGSNVAIEPRMRHKTGDGDRLGPSSLIGSLGVCPNCLGYAKLFATI
jgi:hypothetical protein